MRIKGINIPEKKHLEIALTAIYGIGHFRAKKILKEAGVSKDKLASDLTPDEEKAVRGIAENYTSEGDLKKEIAENIKRLKDIKCYRGTRHAKSLPARGQRTKTNSRTKRGNVRKTMGSGRTKVDKK
ncbi:MAG: 30S ribosomal protein S13 [Parcubacteria group bacterium CG10_big_fil_rev_8_21_14_0_10_38_31]|nr:MAG: 30S ribosomal protein S13 [Parcubacteria group bacterium CG10_big_fil_rev_8_21_14_0_10_38_31]